MKLLVCNFVYVHRILCFLIELVWHLMVGVKWQVLSKAASRLAEGAECLKVFYIFLSETGGGTLGQLPWPTCLGAPHLGGDLPLELLACQSLHIVETFTDEDVARLKVFYQSRVDLCSFLWTACRSTYSGTELSATKAGWRNDVIIGNSYHGVTIRQSSSSCWEFNFKLHSSCRDGEMER